MTITAEADRRIRRVTRGVGALSVVIALAAVAAVVVPGVERDLDRAASSPWRDADPLEAQREAGGLVWAAEGSARITPPAELTDRPVELRLLDGEHDKVQVHLGDASGDSSPPFVGTLFADSSLPLALYSGSELWVSTRQPWRIEILPIDPTALEHSASGNSDALLSYRGPATSGVVTWDGAGSLFVVARTVEGRESLASIGGDLDERHDGATSFTWAASPFVVIEVLAFGDLEWEIRLDVPPVGEEEEER